MLVVMERSATPELVARACKEIENLGLTAHPMPGAQRTAIGVTGNKDQIDADRIATLEGVREIIHVTRPYKLVSREFFPEDSIVDVDGVPVGGAEFVVMAGPCSVESGARIFRGGAFKPRTSPYSFQGLGREGLDILARVRERFGLRIVTEAIDTETVGLVSEYADIVQVGARNMQNFSLLMTSM